MIRRTMKRILPFLAALLLLTSIAYADGETLHIEGGAVSGDVYQVLFRYEGAETPSAENVHITVAGAEVQTRSVTTYAYADLGTSTVILADTNTAVTQRALGDEKLIAKTIAEGLSAADNLCVLPLNASKEDFKLLAKEDALQAIDALEGDGVSGDLYGAIANALTFLCESEDVCPRRCLVVIADGLDNSLSGISGLELQSKIKDAGVPICTVALTYKTENTERIEAAKTLAGFSRLSPGGYQAMLLSDGTTPEKAAADILARRDSTYLAVLEQESLGTALGSAEAEFSVTIQTEAGEVTDARTLSLAGVSAQPPTPLPAQTSQPAESASPMPAEPEKQGVFDALPTWALIALLAGGVVIVAAVVVISLLMAKNRRAREEVIAPQKDGNVVYFDRDDASEARTAQAASGDGAVVCIVKLGAREEICLQSRVSGAIVIGTDPRRAQLILTDNPSAGGANCRIAWREKALVIERIDPYAELRVNGVPAGGSFQLSSGDVLRIGAEDYRVFWDRD